MFVLTKKTQYTCTAIVMLYFVQTTVGYQTQLCWSRGHGAVVAVCWPGFNLHCEQFLFLFFPFFLELSFYDTKDTVKSKVLLCKISKELFATQLTQILSKFCKKREPRRFLVQFQCVIRCKTQYQITHSCGGQLEIMVLQQSGEPGSTCALQHFSILFFCARYSCTNFKCYFRRRTND